jgi:DnaJ like chaperone protein
MGFFGFIVLFLIGAWIWGKIKGAFSGSSVSAPQQRPFQGHWVNCPYCHESVGVKEDGLWNCPSCQKSFSYQNGRVGKFEDTVPPMGVPLIKLFAKMAKADGVVTKEEIYRIDTILKSEFEPNDRRLAEIRSIFNQAKQTADGYQVIIDLLRDFTQDEPGLREAIVAYLFDIATVDNDLLAPGQEQIIRYAVRSFGIDHMYDRFKSEFVTDLDKHYKVLGCTSQDSFETVRKNYRRLVKEYHPDKYMNKDLPQEFIDLANQRIKEIHEAYEAITRYQKAN